VSNLAAGVGVIPADTHHPEGNATMFSTTYKRPLATLAVVGGLLIAAAPAGATVHSAVTDGTSNTVLFAEASARAPLSYTLQNVMVSGYH
jgi:hypothetical protein